YVPLYLSNYCSGGCSYCGFASDREVPRSRLERPEMIEEMQALKAQGFEDVLLLTGECCPEADFEYLLDATALAAEHFHNVSVEAFAMTQREYGRLGDAGCTGITLYQETYDTRLYEKLHRWGEKKDFRYRLEAPTRALEAGLRWAGIGALLGLSNPVSDLIALFAHAQYLMKRFWRSGVLISFPRICEQRGDYIPEFAVDEQLLAQAIFAFRICLPDVPLVLSTREGQRFRDGIAGVGISRMSIASRTTVGGYAHSAADPKDGQFLITDTRDVETFCAALQAKRLEPVFKNWDRVFQNL
ncbi:MAG TPA: radical SAM protein, partial [bacterium]|nr:radical SAM protein [bacterium]